MARTGFFETKINKKLKKNEKANKLKEKKTQHHIVKGRHTEFFYKLYYLFLRLQFFFSEKEATCTKRSASKEYPLADFGFEELKTTLTKNILQKQNQEHEIDIIKKYLYSRGYYFIITKINE